MNIHDINLPPEFQSGNSVPVSQATIKRERMIEILRFAIAPYQQRIAELESQLEAIGAGGVDGRRLIGDSCHQRIEELEAELQELQRQWVEHDTLGCPTAKTGIYASKADRQRRGEPVAWIRKNGFRFIAEIEPQDDSEVPLYAAPQPAESHVDRANRIVDSWPEWKRNYALTKHDVKPTQPADPSGASTLHNAGSGAQNGIQVTQPAEPVEAPSPHEFNTGNEKLDALLDDTFYLAKDGGMDNAIKWQESLEEFLASIEPVKVPSDEEIEELWQKVHQGIPWMSIRKFARALLARYGQPVEPEGWQVVPKEPTPEMLHALMEWDLESGLTTRAEYQAMLKAAPKFGEEE